MCLAHNSKSLYASVDWLISLNVSVRPLDIGPMWPETPNRRAYPTRQFISSYMDRRLQLQFISTNSIFLMPFTSPKSHTSACVYSCSFEMVPGIKCDFTKRCTNNSRHTHTLKRLLFPLYFLITPWMSIARLYAVGDIEVIVWNICYWHSCFSLFIHLSFIYHNLFPLQIALFPLFVPFFTLLCGSSQVARIRLYPNRMSQRKKQVILGTAEKKSIDFRKWINKSA